MITITLFRADGWWMARSTDPEVKRLFDTDTLPTPFRASLPKEYVQVEIEQRNPAAIITIEGK